MQKEKDLNVLKKEKAERFNIEFETWFEELTKDQRQEIANELKLDKIPKHVHQEAYQSYFKDKVFEG